MADLSILDVRLYDRSIATLTCFPGDRTVLAFTPSYADDTERPVLSLSFHDAFGHLITNQRPTQRVLPPFFANLLPEGVLRRYLADRAGVHVQREFFLLQALGRDLPGAVTVQPLDLGTAMAEPDGEAPTRPAERYRFSLAGVQLKFSALWNDGKIGGLTIPADGVGGGWIVKLPSQHFGGVPENEYSMMMLARMIGIDCPDIALIDPAQISGLPAGIGDLRGQAFAVRRFDRADDGPVHIEDFAQIFGVFPDEKYQRASYASIGRVIGAETDGATVEEYIRRLVFCALIGNGDMHLKNWSLCYPDRRTPRLSPAYDLVSTIAYIDGEDSLALNLSRTRLLSKFDCQELIHLAGRARLPEQAVLAAARDCVQRFRALWPRERPHLPLDVRVAAAIDRHAPTVPLFQELS